MAVVKIVLDGKWQTVSTKPWPPAKAQAIAEGLRKYGFEAKTALA